MDIFGLKTRSVSVELNLGHIRGNFFLESYDSRA